MKRLGKSFRVQLKKVHLHWGTTSSDNTRNRHENEAYIPIPATDARRLKLKRSLLFDVVGTSFQLRVSGSQGDEDYGKNFESAKKLTLLGEYLKDVLKAKPGDWVTVHWETEKKVSILLDTV